MDQQPPSYPTYPTNQPFSNQQPPFLPQSQPPLPKKRSILRRPVPLWLLLVLLIVVFAIGDSIGHSETSASTTPATTTASQPASGTPAPTPTATATPKPLAWTTTQAYTGNGDKKTGTFVIAGNDWKLLWSCDPASFGGQYNVIVEIDNSNDNTPMDPGAVNTLCKSGNTSGETEEHQGGTFYMSVTSEAAWTIKLQELK